MEPTEAWMILYFPALVGVACAAYPLLALYIVFLGLFRSWITLQCGAYPGIRALSIYIKVGKLVYSPDSVQPGKLKKLLDHASPVASVATLWGSEPLPNDPIEHGHFVLLWDETPCYKVLAYNLFWIRQFCESAQ